MDVLSLLVAVVVGVGIGVLSGMLGIGGGTVMVPVFKLGFGMTAIGATATSLFAIIPTAISGGVTHVRQRTCIPKLGVLAGIGGACLSPVGVYLASVSPGWVIMLAAAVVIGYSSVTMFKKALKAPKQRGFPSHAPEQSGPPPCHPERSERSERSRRISPVPTPDCSQAEPLETLRLRAARSAQDDTGEARASTVLPNNRHADAAELSGSSLTSVGEPGAMDSPNYWLGLPIGAAAGLVAGYVGVGGGFLMVPLFLSIVGISMKKASGTSLLAIAILSIPGTIEQLLLGNVAIGIALAVVVGSIPGAALGAKLVKRIPERQLRFAFAVILFVAAILLVVQELGVF